MKLEHANVTVLNIEKAKKFLGTAFPEFRVRGEGDSGEGANERHWVHFGTDSTYIALEQLKTEPPPPAREPYFQAGLNHLGFEVEDINELHARLTAAGYGTNEAAKEPFRKRIYAYDDLGNEWEFVGYFSQEPTKRNQYL